MYGTTRPPPHRVSIPHPLYGKGHLETHVKFWSRSNDGSKVMARSNRYSGLERPELVLPEYRFHIHYTEKGHPQTRKILIAIQRLDQKLWLVRTVTLAWRDQTSSSPSIDSTSTIWKRTSRNSCKLLIAIQQSDQKLWPVRTVTLAWRDQTSTSRSIDSTSTTSKRASRNSCKI